MRKKEKIWVMVIKQVLITLLMCVAVSLPVGYRYLSIKFTDVSMAQLIFHLNTNLTGTNWDGFGELFRSLLHRNLAAVFAGVVMFFVLWLLRDKHFAFRLIPRAFVVVCCLIVIGVVYVQFSQTYQLKEYLQARKLKTEVYEEYYVEPSKARILFPEQRKNLIYIFLESMEVTNADQQSGGGLDVNTIPGLTWLALENDCFNGSDPVRLNGAYPLGNTTWTIAGMVAQTAGVPLDIPIRDDDYFADTFLPGAYSLGEILKAEGYHNCLMLGSDAEFANRKGYFEEHGDYEICDYYWAIDQNLIDEDYYVWWGFEDQKLFQYAKDKVLELASKEEPFNLTLLTVDTHFTDGYVCELCEEEYPEQFSNVLSCNSRQLTAFVHWLQEQDFYEDTVIVLSGDHLSMDANYYYELNQEGFDRKTYVTFINSAKEEPQESRVYSTMDLYPTTLSAMGCTIEGDRLGLGTDLYSERETLTEQMGKEEFDYQLDLSSPYYERNILYKSK